MVAVLGALVMGMIAIGFTLLAVIPLMFVWLGYTIFREPASSPMLPATPEGEGVPEATAEPAPPRVMVAGRRRPL